MYSGLLPKGLTEDDLSPDDEEDEQEEDVGEKRERGRGSSAEKLSSAGGNTGSVVEGQSTHAASDADSEPPTCSMPGISQEMWQVCRFSVQ